MAAGLATLDVISADGFYTPLFEYAAALCEGMEAAAAEAGVAFTTNHAGTMFGGFFTDRETVTNYSEVMDCDTGAFSRFFHALLDHGVYIAPASYEAGFVSAAHGDTELNATLEAARKAFAAL
jgi:glutamate-1-semialdehyde 2,1-aminomutase